MSPERRAWQRILLCLGDSITYGFPYGPASSWVRALHGKIPAVPLNSGVNGDTNAGMLRRLEGEIKNPGVTHVHILGGANDAWMQTDPGQSRHCVERMVQLCTGRGIQPILGLSTPVCPNPGGGDSFFPFGLEEIIAWLSEHRKWLRDYAAAQSIPLIDYFNPLCLPGTSKGDPRYFLDEAHLSPAGNGQMSRVAQAALEKILSELFSL